MELGSYEYNQNYNNDYQSELDEIFKMAHELRDGKGLHSPIGKKFNNGFTIDKSMAIALIKTYAPEKVETHADEYTIDTIRGESQLIAMLKDGTVMFTVPLEKSTFEEQTISMDYSKTLEAMKETTAQYKRIRYLGYLGLGIFCLIAIGVYVLSIKLSILM